MSPRVFDVPELKSIFKKILKDQKPYCGICFRTNDEVRLVTPKYFKKFMLATRTRNQPTVGSICYICEHKSRQALTLYRSAVFSTTIKVLLDDLRRRKVVEDDVIFELKHFKRILNKVGLRLTPQEVQSEMQQIRTNNHLSETNVVITDSTNAIKQLIDDTEEKLVPNNNASFTPPEGPRLRPIRPKLPNVPQNKFEPSTSIQDNMSTVPWSCEPTQSKDTAVYSATSNAQVTMKSSIGKKVVVSSNKQPETIIIDDEEGQANVTSNIINKMIPLGKRTNLHVLTQLSDLNVTTPNVPKIMTVNDMQNISNKIIILHDIYMTNDNTYSVPSLGAKIVNDTVIFYDSEQKVIAKQELAWSAEFLKQNTIEPKLLKNKSNRACVDNPRVKMIDVSTTNIQNYSTQSNNSLPVNTTDRCQNGSSSLNDISDSIIVNAIDTDENKGLVVINTGDGILKRFMMLPPGLPSINTFVNVNVVQDNTAANTTDNILFNNQISNSCQFKSVTVNSIQDVTDNRKRKKIDNVSNNSCRVLSNDLNITNITISEITSDMDVAETPKKPGTDWEDKIPMDVISFVDAVDPNADKVLKIPNVMYPPTIQISEPISLANQSVAVNNDVIDLC